MFKKLSLAMSVLLVLLALGPATVESQEPDHSDPIWQVYFWNNMTLSGGPVAHSNHERIDWNWGAGSPHESIQADQFSARWTRYIDLAAGRYRFTATCDDGMRVYVDGQAIIDQWHDHPVRTYVADVDLAAGHHFVTVEYYENMGDAVAMVSWGPIDPSPDIWHGEYFGNRWLSGTPVLVRNDAEINFWWGYAAPAPGIPGDGFSARWTRTADFESGTYRFTATSDDGIRAYVDGRLIIDEWYDHSVRTYEADVNMTAGSHQVVVEFYENTGHAVAGFSWRPVPPAPRAWLGEYYGNRWFSGSPVLVRDDPTIDFRWGAGSPGSGVPSDGFSVRWTRTIRFEPGHYRFTTTTDDGVRLWVNGHLLIDKWQDQPPTSYSGTIHLSGDVFVKMVYYENAGGATAKLLWTRVGDDPPPPAPGTVIVDDRDPGFVKGGASSAWHTASEGHGGRLLWTWNNDRVRSNYNWARWYPNLAPGTYEVFVYVPESYATTTKARYWVSHRGGYTLRILDQSANGGRWVSLGDYSFRGNREDYVSLADVTYERYLSRRIAFDAIKWVPR